MANHPSYRPTVLEAGRHANRSLRARSRTYGQAIKSSRYRLIRCLDGHVTIPLGSPQEAQSTTIDHQLNPGDWALIAPQSSPHPLSLGPQCRWSEIRFSVTPQEQEDPQPFTLWGTSLPIVLNSDSYHHQLAAFDDILAWWWRDPWHRWQADVRLGSLLLALVRSHRNESVANQTDSAAATNDLNNKNLQSTLKNLLQNNLTDHRLEIADRIWASRPRAPIAEVAAACGYSERQFRRVFQHHRRMTPTTWAHRLLIDQACVLLREKPLLVHHHDRPSSWLSPYANLHSGFRATHWNNTRSMAPN